MTIHLRDSYIIQDKHIDYFIIPSNGRSFTDIILFFMYKENFYSADFNHTELAFAVSKKPDVLFYNTKINEGKWIKAGKETDAFYKQMKILHKLEKFGLIWPKELTE